MAITWVCCLRLWGGAPKLSKSWIEPMKKGPTPWSLRRWTRRPIRSEATLASSVCTIAYSPPRDDDYHRHGRRCLNQKYLAQIEFQRVRRILASLRACGSNFSRSSAAVSSAERTPCAGSSPCALPLRDRRRTAVARWRRSRLWLSISGGVSPPPAADAQRPGARGPERT